VVSELLWVHATLFHRQGDSYKIADGKTEDGNCNDDALWLIDINTELETEKVSETFRGEKEK
jgi:hypothetical protein